MKSEDVSQGQCQFFVMRKKRLCRMTVRPGRQYCGEHEPQPKTDDGEIDTRIPCPNDPKHTCYASKLEKHLSICNARPTELPEYIIPNVNIPLATDTFSRIPLSEVPQEKLLKVIDKVNSLYDKHVKHEITTLEEMPIHWTVLEEFNDPTRTESSRRHLRQTSSLLHVMEQAGLVQDHTCYVELGAGKGIVSYYLWRAWCSAPESTSAALLVDRAALRHKRDNKLRGDRIARLRADLADLALEKVPIVKESQSVVGLAKHLCGVATDHALRCVTAARGRGLVLATCCHHRCRPALYVAREQMQELGITDEDFNTMLGIVSWATCGDGRPRDKRGTQTTDGDHDDDGIDDSNINVGEKPTCVASENHRLGENLVKSEVIVRQLNHDENLVSEQTSSTEKQYRLDANVEDSEKRQHRALTGRRAKALLDWGRVAALRSKGFDARLVQFVSEEVSPENLAIVAVK
ncbi:LOW QUALITY PROTEIN: tRNA:m(4)X modification enzyme TRM13 homolog [Amyelois transitella]|uniref:LOW QUALITY PROTEIN: tRNA:m(4)X modification enzyme TRM13 homolog n=1 Tax=Amyelois transitella TaxID=680683 RepID=UPI00298FEF13|nr:LOW QUALITY PROTEIN: tRNA:m(4)X modification enzyme TRM13 homolog [Amyelois transitella]